MVTDAKLAGAVVIVIVFFLIVGSIEGWFKGREIITYGGRCKSGNHRYIRNGREYMCSRYDFREEDGSIDYDGFYHHYLNCTWYKY